MNDVNQITSSNKSQKTNTVNLVMTGMFTAIICVMSQISIPTQPIPFTLALFAIFLTGALLPPRYALLSVLTYLLIGAIGIPVFSSFRGGLERLVGPTGGYLAAYPIMAFVTALFYKYFNKYKVVALAIGMVISLILCYTIGTLWFSHISGNSFYSALFICVFPYVVFDLLKIVLAISVSMVIRRTVYKSMNL
ncbi:MAG: biotin transporter BioY [Herbinix sp.]|nr:biotin transporter BioY [Herbinix sp.]